VASYSEYLISNMATGLYLAKDPWLAPSDAFPTLVNRYVEKGVLKRRRGYSEYVSTGLGGYPVVGFGSVQYSGYNEVLVCTTKRVFNLHDGGDLTDLSGGSDIFTGDEDDYFWFQQYKGNLYFCNGVDGIYKYTPNYDEGYSVTAMDTGDVTIESCSLLLQYKNRLLIIGPKIDGVWYPNYAYYTDVNMENVGETNFVKAQTDDTPVSGGYIRDVPVVFFSSRAWQISYTFNTDAPFTWERKSFEFGTAAKMGTVEMKDRLALVGSVSLIGYDGYQGIEYDLPVKGIVKDWLSATKIVNSYAHRIKGRNYIAIAYTRVGQTDHDRILYYSLDENNFSVSDIAVNALFSIKGYWRPKGNMPGNFILPVQDRDYREIELGGTKDGKILRLNYGRADNGSEIATSVLSSHLNPFVREGKKVKFGWIKFLINGPSAQGLQVKLYKDGNSAPFKTFDLYSAGEINHWQSVYADGEVGDYFQVGITDLYGTNWTGPDFDIHGAICAFRPATRSGRQTEYVADTSDDLITTNWRWYNDMQHLYIQRKITGTWTTKHTFEDFWGVHRIRDDGTDLQLEENRGDGNWVSRRTWEDVTGNYAWVEFGTNLLLQLDGVTKWTLEG